jgi:hypothetical protein
MYHAWERCEMNTKFWLENLKGRDDFDRHESIWEDSIKIDIKESGYEIVNWIYLEQDKNQWWALVNTVLSFRLAYITGNFFSS